MLDIGEEQLLVLLLVMDAELDDCLDVGHLERATRVLRMNRLRGHIRFG